MADKNNLPKFTRNMYQGPIDDSATAEVYRRPLPKAKTKKPSYPVKEVDYSLGAYQRRFGQKPRTKLVNVNNRWSKIMDDYSYTPTVNATLPEVDVVAKRKTNTTATAPATKNLLLQRQLLQIILLQIILLLKSKQQLLQQKELILQEDLLDLLTEMNQQLMVMQ
jgi:hypothetical protein